MLTSYSAIFSSDRVTNKSKKLEEFIDTISSLQGYENEGITSFIFVMKLKLIPLEN